MYAVACEGVKEYGECCHEGLTLTRCHLGNLALVKNNTTKDLNIIVYHFPLEVVAACCPVVVVYGLVAVDGDEVVFGILCKLTVEVGGGNHCLLVFSETTGCVLYDAESHRHDFVESLLVQVEHFLLQLVDGVEDRLALINRSLLNLSLQLGNLSLLLVS